MGSKYGKKDLSKGIDKSFFLAYTLNIKLFVNKIKNVKKEGIKIMLEKMREMIAEQLSVEAETITEASNFKDDLGADSLDLFELVMSLEEEFGVEIPSEDLEKIATVGEIIDYFKDKGVES